MVEAFDKVRLVHIEEPATLFQQIEQALIFYKQVYRQPDGADLIYSYEFPKTRLSKKPGDPFDVVTFKVISSLPAPGKSATPVAPFTRWTRDDPENKGYKLVMQQQKEMTICQFTIWSKSNFRAQLLTNWFHRFMRRLGFGYQFLKARGVDWFRFVARGEDKLDTQEGQELYFCTLQYEFRLTTNELSSSKTLEEIDIHLGTVQEPATNQYLLTDEPPA